MIHLFSPFAKINFSKLFSNKFLSFINILVFLSLFIIKTHYFLKPSTEKITKTTVIQFNILATIFLKYFLTSPIDLM